MVANPMNCGWRSIWLAGMAMAVLFSGCSEAPDLSGIAPLKGRVAARQAELTRMKGEGLCAENSSGMLGRSPTAALSLEQRTLIEEENYDRERIFEALASAYSLSSADVRSVFVGMQSSR